MNHYCKEYDDNCEGCQPAIADQMTGQILPKDSPKMIRVRAYWKTVPLADKQACHRVWCFNSRAPSDMAALERVGLGIQRAMSNT